MKKQSVVVYVISFLAIFGAPPVVTNAQAPASPPAEKEAQLGKKESEFPDPVERFLKSAPASMVRKLNNEATAALGAAELTKYFGKNAINKWVVVHTKAEVVEPTPGGRNAARIGAESVPVKWEGGSMARLSWLYFPLATAPVADDVKVGTEIAVRGQVRRCEIVMFQGALRFNFDLWKAKVENP